MFRYLQALGIIFSLLLPVQLWAAGMTMHFYASDKAIDEINDPVLKTILENNRDIYISAANFPDYGGESKRFSEYTDKYSVNLFDMGHSPVFIDVALDKISRDFDLANCSAECQQAVAFTMGVVAHSIQDSIWDPLFIRKSFLKDHNTDDIWVDDLDITGDLSLIIDKGIYYLPSHEMPIPFLQSLYPDIAKLDSHYAEIAKHNMPEQYFKLAGKLHRRITRAEWWVSPFFYIYDKFNAPWTLKNVQSDPWAIPLLINTTAQQINAMWARMNKRPYNLVHFEYPAKTIAADAFPAFIFSELPQGSSFSTDNVKLKDAQGKDVELDIYCESQVVTLYPKAELEAGQSYQLSLNDKLQSVRGTTYWPQGREITFTASASEQLWRNNMVDKHRCDEPVVAHTH